MRRLFAGLMMLAMTVGLVGCGEERSSSSGSYQPPAPTPVSSDTRFMRPYAATRPAGTPPVLATVSVGSRGDVELLQYDTYASGISKVRYVVGVVRNNGSEPYADIEVTLTLFGDEDLVLATDEAGDLSGLMLDPGEQVGFTMLLDPVPAEWVKEEVRVVAKAYPNDDYFYHKMAGLRVTGTNLVQTSNGDYQVVGRLRNESQQIASGVKLIATGYDADDRIVAVDYTFPPGHDDFPPGEAASFSLRFNRSNIQVVRFDLFISAHVKDN